MLWPAGLLALGTTAASVLIMQVAPTPDAIQATAERLTLITALAFGLVAFQFGWVRSGKTADAAIERALQERDAAVKAAGERADARVAETRAAYEREIVHLQAEISRLQSNEAQWQQITLNALGELDRSGRIVERGVVQPLERQLGPGGRLLAREP
jgi:hypothetical protein